MLGVVDPGPLAIARRTDGGSAATAHPHARAVVAAVLAAAGVTREPGQDIDAAARVIANELETAEMRGRAEGVLTTRAT